MKKILIFSNNFFPISGTFLYRQVHGAVSENSIIMAAFKFENEELFPLPGVEKTKIRIYYGLMDRVLLFLRRKVRGTSLTLSFHCERMLQKIGKQNNVHLIHAHYGTMGVQILTVARRLNVPLVVSFHGYDASIALKRMGYRDQLKQLFDYASRIIIVSEHMISSLGLGAWASKVSFIPYGIDVTKFTRKHAYREEHLMKIRILHSGRLASKKGVPDLIQVFSKIAHTYENVTLHILGEGQDELACRDLVNTLALEQRVIFYGAQPQSEVLRLMNECSIFVLNSRISDDGDMEGLPNSILEAMSMEMAVVSTYHAGIPSAIENGISGLLVPERDNEALHHALKKLLDDRLLLQDLSRNARKRVLEEFNIENMVEKINAVYRSVT